MAGRRKTETIPEPPDEVENNAALQEVDFDDSDDFEDERSTVAEFDAEVSALNDPDVDHLDDPPVLGGDGRSYDRTSDLFGESAEYALGRAMSPRLYAQAAQFPTCAQLRIWKWENGIPVGLGAIDAGATEEDLVRRFASAMPKKGDQRAQFKLRPIDIRGQELGQEVTVIISEHHVAIQSLRQAEEEESAEGPRGFYGNNNGAGSDAYGEMGRMFEHALDASEQRSRALEHALEDERERIRLEDSQRAQERIDLATNAAQGVQALTERMMNDESQRSDRSMRMQNEQSNMLLTTLTSIFGQQQSMSQQSADQQRRADEFRLEQERQRADRDRRDHDENMKGQREEWGRKRAQEREEAETRFRNEREESSRRYDQQRLELESRLQREREDMERKEKRERDESERRDRWMSEERERRDKREGEEARARDTERQRQHERMLKDVEMSAQRDREHQERMLALSKIELKNEQSAGGLNILGNAAGFLKQFGVEPTDILPRLFTPEQEEKGGWLEALPKLLGAASDVVGATMGKNQPQLPGGTHPALLPPPMPGQMYGPDGFPGGMPPGGMPPGPPPMPGQPIGPEGEEEEEDPAAQMKETPAQTRTRMLSDEATVGGVGLGAQKNARIALRNLVRGIQQSPEDQWTPLIIQALQAELAIYHYVNAVTVRAALLEAGGSPKMVDSICSLMQASPVVPEDLPYG